MSSPEQQRELERLRAENPDDFRHGDEPPRTPAADGTRWVRCWKNATGPKQEPGWRWEAIDLPIADLVEQLQRSDGGPPLVPTAGRCGGHQQGDLPHVLLDDGRVLVVLPSMAALGLAEEAIEHARLRREAEG